MYNENLSQASREIPEKIFQESLLKKIRSRADVLINIGFLQTRMWMVVAGISIVAATYGLEFSSEAIKKVSRGKEEVK